MKRPHNLKGCKCPKGSSIRFCIGNDEEVMPDSQSLIEFYLTRGERHHKLINNAIEEFKSKLIEEIEYKIYLWQEKLRRMNLLNLIKNNTI